MKILPRAQIFRCFEIELFKKNLIDSLVPIFENREKVAKSFYPTPTELNPVVLKLLFVVVFLLKVHEKRKRLKFQGRSVTKKRKCYIFIYF